MPMINLSIAFDMANCTDPAGMCVLYTDENKVAHIQNLVLGGKAELIYRLLTTPTSEYLMRGQCDDGVDIVEIRFKREGI